MGKRLFVGNLPYETMDDELRDIFAAAGQVSSARVILSRETGTSKGFGFVEMGSEEEAQAAVAKFNKSQIGRRMIVVEVAKPIERRTPSGRPGGIQRYDHSEA
jgi:RNA recognition motif-containing protein